MGKLLLGKEEGTRDTGFQPSTSCDSARTQIKGVCNLNRLTQNTHTHTHTTQICCLGIKIIFLDCYIYRLKSNDAQKDSDTANRKWVRQLTSWRLRAQRCVCTAAAPTLINQEGDKVSVLLSTFTSWLLEGTCVLTFWLFSLQKPPVSSTSAAVVLNIGGSEADVKGESCESLLGAASESGWD